MQASCGDSPVSLETPGWTTFATHSSSTPGGRGGAPAQQAEPAQPSKPDKQQPVNLEASQATGDLSSLIAGTALANLTDVNGKLVKGQRDEFYVKDKKVGAGITDGNGDVKVGSPNTSETRRRGSKDSLTAIRQGSEAMTNTCPRKRTPRPVSASADTAGASMEATILTAQSAWMCVDR